MISRFFCVLTVCRAANSQKMNKKQTTLLNGSTTKAGVTPASAGVMPGAIPKVENQHKADDLRNGAKRDNVLPATGGANITDAEKTYPYDNKKTWFVLRVNNGKALEARSAVGKDILFVPAIHVVERKNGRRVTTEKPLIANLLFIYATKAAADDYMSRPALSFLAYQYDHCQKNKYGRSVPMTVGYREMINFINATSTDEEDVRIVDESKLIRYKSDDMVEVTTGKFKGVKGRVARLAGQQRVVVQLKGILNFATTYIPNCWLRKIEAE